MAFVTSSVSPMLGEHMPLVFQVEERPVVMVSTEVDTTSVATIATIGSSVGIVFHMFQVHGTPAALS